MNFVLPSFAAGLVLSLSLIIAIGPQNAHVLRMGLTRQHVWLTVLVCMVSDVLLIALGVVGLAALGGLSGTLHTGLVGAGILFLAVYGLQAWRRFWSPAAVVAELTATGGAMPTTAPMSRRQAALAALAFSWLNPHAWLDTAVLIGTASLAHGEAGRLFGVGAAAGSVLWFGFLGAVTFWLGRRLESLQLWRLLDGLVALMMWGTAGLLLNGLLRSA